MVRSREVSGLIPLIRSDPSQLNRPWPQKSVESILIIHHYPTFSGGLVLQLGLARSSGPHFPAARASITRRRQLASHNGQAHTLQPLPPRFLYKYLLPSSHMRYIWVPLKQSLLAFQAGSLDFWSTVGGGTTLPACPPPYLLSDKLLP